MMQIMAVAGKQPSEVVTHGRLRRCTASLCLLSTAHFQSEVSMDLDPRWTDDPRDRGRELSQGSRAGLSILASASDAVNVSASGREIAT